MKKLLVVVAMVLSLGLANAVLLPAAEANAATGCNRTFLVFPSWCRGLDNGGSGELVSPCADDGSGCGGKMPLTVFIWTIILNISDILFRLAGMIAVFFVMYAGFQYLRSDGQSDKIGKAKLTLQNALIGLVIAIMAAAIVNTIMGVIS